MKKRNLFGAALASAALLLSGTAHAQIEQFVVTGPAADRILEKNQISGETARRIAESCEAYAAANGRTLSIFILDQFGNMVHMHRMDGQGYNNIKTAEMKARTALLSRAPTSNRMNAGRENPFDELRQIALGFFPNAGGLPIVVDNQLIGVIGVGGAAPSPEFSDELCAYHALNEVLGPQPPLPGIDAPRDPFTGEREWCTGGAGPDPAVGGTCD
jgi:glc operon protein GlcG